MNQDPNSPDANSQDQQNAQEAAAPIDDAISHVETYIQNPKMVTPDTLNQLLDLLNQVKDEDMTETGDQSQGDNSPQKPSIIAQLGNSGGQ